MRLNFEVDLEPVFGGQDKTMTPEEAAIMKANLATLITLGTAFLGTAEGMTHFRRWVLHQAQCDDPTHNHEVMGAADFVRVVKTMLNVSPNLMRDISDLFEPLTNQLWAEVYPEAQPEPSGT
jgi:hypothetical protein